MEKNTGPVYSFQEVEKACDLIEIFFGRTYFKKGIEELKDSDPNGAGMGREYGSNKASKLMLAWHRAKEELAFSILEGYYRPGRYGSLIGSLGEDIKALQSVPGIKEAAAGLLDDSTFDSTLLLLSLAAKMYKPGGNLFFPVKHASIFKLDNTIFLILSFYPENKEKNLASFIKLSLEEISNIINYDENAGSRLVVYIHHAGPDLTVPENELNDIKASAAMLCKTEFLSGTSGVYRQITCTPLK
ncbi:MAG: hypothetical protein ACOY46_12320 [Bacillota bacterium]